VLELHRRPTASHTEAAARTQERELVAVVLALAGAVLFYAGAFWLRGFRIPIGDDSFFYVSAIRIAGRLGLATSHLASRPAYPLVGSMVGSVVRSSPWTTAVALPFAMAAGAAAAAAAMAARWGVRRWALGGFLFLAGASVVLGRLVAGRSENLMNVWLLAAALAVWIWSTGRARVVGTGLLVSVAGLAEWPFLAAFLAILGCTVAAAWIASRTDGIGDTGLADLATISVAAMGAVAVMVFAVNGTVPGDAVQRLPPADRYRPFLMETLRTYMPLLTGPAVVAGWLAVRRVGPGRLGGLRRLLGMWLLLTGLVVVAGILGVKLPTYRALTFALPVAVATAAAPFLPGALAARSLPDRQPLWKALAVGLALAALLPGALMWYRAFRPRTNAGELGQIAAVAGYAAALPPGTTVVATYEKPDLLKALYYEGVFDALLPAAQRGRVQLFPGTAEEALAGSLPAVVDPGARDTARELFEDVADPLAAGAPIVALRAFDPSGFSQGLVGSASRIGDRVIVVRGPPPSSTVEASGTFVPLPVGWALLLWSLAMLLVLTLAGVGWSRVALPSAPAAVRLAVAPAFGVVALTLLGLAAATAGVTPAGAVGPALVGVGVASSLGAAWRTRRSPPTT
jgi:hypothetical protein